MNVIGARPDHWWRDRDAAVRRLVAQLRALAGRSGETMTVVLDGRPVGGLEDPDASPGVLPASEADGGRRRASRTPVSVLFADRRGPDAADDRIVQLLEAEADPAAIVVFTSDRALRARAENLGATVEGARSLLRRLDEFDPGTGSGTAPGGR